MARKLDNILVIDLEATCWEGAPPPGQQSDIIEIGVCSVDVRTLEPGESRGLLVRPERSRVSSFCTDLTTLTEAQVFQEGRPLAEALKVLRKEYDSENRAFASYGDYDRRMIERQCRDLKLRYPFGPTHLNVKNLTALALGLHQEVGMAEALEKLGLPLQGTHHRGVDDARNIANILCHVLRKARTEFA